MLAADVSRFLSSTDGCEGRRELSGNFVPNTNISDTARGRRRAKRIQLGINRRTTVQMELSSTTCASSELESPPLQSQGYPDAASFALPETSTSKISEVGELSLHEGGSSSRRDTKGCATMSQRRDKSSRVTLVRKEGMELPIGVFYEEMSGDCYEIDVTRMEQTHVESGSVRKVRLEKPCTWRFSKQGGGWGTYPRDVCMELNRVYLTHTYGLHPDKNNSLDPKDDAKVKPVPPASLILSQGVQSSANEFAGQSIASMTALSTSLHGGLRSIRSTGRLIDWLDRFDRFKRPLLGESSQTSQDCFESESDSNESRDDGLDSPKSVFFLTCHFWTN